MKHWNTVIALGLLGGLHACSSDDPVANQESSQPAVTGQNAPQAATEADRTQPNILFIVADDMGFTDIGAFGSEIPTPTLDRLGYAGVRLNNLHAAAACRPARLMLMASASSAAANHPLPEADRGGVLGLHYATISELLQDAGYATYITGKWDLGNVEGYTPDARGFDRSFVQISGSGPYFAEYFRDAFGYQEDGRALTPDDVPEDFYATRAYTDKMLEYIDSTDEGAPWFAYMPYTAPHWPLQLPDDWLDRHAGRYDDGYDVLREQRFERAGEAGVLPTGSSLDDFEPVTEPWSNLSPEEQRRYARAQEIFAGMFEYLDMSIGRVVAYLEENGQLENTVIVFSADHGASAGEHGVDTGRVPAGGGPTYDPDVIDNSLENFGRRNSFIDHGRGFGEAATAPFRYQKGALAEGGLRAAAIVYYPAAVPGGGVSSEFMTFMDFLPTFLEIAGTEHPGAGPYRDGRTINDIVGRSAWPHLTGNASTVHPPGDAAGWSGGMGGTGALIRGNNKIINQVPPGSAGTTPWRLYDLSVDPGEHHDRAAEHPDLVAEMVEEWETNWR